jgi:hypothetical protein
MFAKFQNCFLIVNKMADDTGIGRYGAVLMFVTGTDQELDSW